MKKIIFALSLLALVGGASAFTAISTQKQVAVRYQFQGNTTQEALDPANWIVLDEQDETPGCVSGELPCYVETEMSIEAWLSDKTQSNVADEADASRD
jgi:hypothetical protein